MKNKEVAEALNQISELLVLKNENLFKVRAYERAGEVIASLPEPIEFISDKKKLTEIPGIGESIADKVSEYLRTGKIAFLEELKASFPEGLFEIMKLQGVGPKKAKALYDKLKVKNLDDLKEAAVSGRINGIAGFGKKSEENILKGLEQREKFAGRVLLNEAMGTADEILAGLRKLKYVKRADAAGSLRRLRETVGDIDILCSAEKDKAHKVIEYFTKLPAAVRVLAAGPTKASISTATGLQIDLRVVEDASYGAALLYFTGSKEHGIHLRGIARDKGLTVNEYGVYKLKDLKNPVASKTEEEMYRALGLSYIPPELRENRGEIEASLAGALPGLIEQGDIKGDTHVHSSYSDGADSLKAIAEKAKALGYEWLIVTDHSQSLKIARGLSVSDLKKKIKEIESVNAGISGFRLLCGTEADILNDGTIDYPDEILSKLDFVLASIHGGFNQSESELTGRIIKAIENPHVHCIGHPTGRLLNEREPYAVNMDRVIAAAKKHGKLLEIDAFPDRLDLNDVYCRKAMEAGVKLTIGSDSHSIAHLGYMKLGVSVARRGWLKKNDVINTLSLDKLTAYLK